MLSKMKLGIKVLLGFVVLTVIVCAIGIIGVVNLKKIENADTMLYEKMTVPLGVVGDISGNFHRLRGNIRDLIITDNSKLQDYLGRVRGREEAIESNFEPYEKNILTEDGRKAFAKFKSAYNNYTKFADRIVNMVKRGDRNGARLLLLSTEGGRVNQETIKALEYIVEQKIEVAKAASDKNTAMADAAVMLMLIFIGMAILASAALTIVIMKNISGIINGMMKEINNVARDSIDGKLSSRANINEINFEFRAIGEGMNNILDAVIGPLNVAAEYVDRISNGDIPSKITDSYSGDFNEIKNNLNKCIDAVNNMIEDADMLAKSSVEGRLATRADASKHQGDFRRIIEGVNNTLDAVIGPLNMAAEYVERISRGDMPPQITDNYNGDFNEIKNNLNALIDSINLVTDISKNIASGNLMLKVVKRSDRDELMGSLQKMIEDLSGFAINVQTASEQVANGSQQISSSSVEMSQMATEQSSSVEEVSSSMEEMNSAVIQNADNARQTASISEKAAKDAQDGGMAVSDTVKAMKSIAEKIGIIEAIAGQTNMLALNAAIEAARAGDHGKGFAVVASEVRNLAERSRTAAKEISALSQESVDIAEKAGKVMEEMVPQIQKTSELIQEINISSAEQARGIEQVTKAIEQLDKAIQQNAAATEEMASTSEELSSQADSLNDVSKFFKIDESGLTLKRQDNQQLIVDLPGTRKIQEARKHTESAAAPAEKETFDSGDKGVILDLNSDEDEEFQRY